MKIRVTLVSVFAALALTLGLVGPAEAATQRYTITKTERNLFSFTPSFTTTYSKPKTKEFNRKAVVGTSAAAGAAFLCGKITKTPLPSKFDYPLAAGCITLVLAQWGTIESAISRASRTQGKCFRMKVSFPLISVLPSPSFTPSVANCIYRTRKV